MKPNIYVYLLYIYVGDLSPPEYELCLDCKLNSAEIVFHHCHSDGHEPGSVLYVDKDCREIVPIPLPKSIGKMSWARKLKAHPLSECRNRHNCSFPHHNLAAEIINQWKESTVIVSKPPTLVSPIDMYVCTLSSCMYLFLLNLHILSWSKLKLGLGLAIYNNTSSCRKDITKS